MQHFYSQTHHVVHVHNVYRSWVDAMAVKT